MIKSKYLQTAIKAARAAAVVLMKDFKKRHVKHFKTESDFSTEADIGAEKIILKIINEKFPDHNIVTEESQEIDNSSDYTWIIDPLDGTINYATGIPYFCVSIAMAFKGRVMVGVVLNPHDKELFYAERDKGAYLNDKRIHVSKVSDITRSYIAGPIKVTELIEPIMKVNKIGYRIFGSSELDYANVACGRIDARLKPSSMKIWDFAAGCLLIEEAGGKITDIEGDKWTLESKQIIASNGKLHNKILDLINPKKVLRLN